MPTPPSLINPNIQLRHAPIPPFIPVPNWKFETAHPYPTKATIWMPLYTPGGGTEMCLKTVGEFKLESNYDFLEIWCWVNNVWTRTKRYTGTVGPTMNDVFQGMYFQLALVSDSSVTGHGFCVTAVYR